MTCQSLIPRQTGWKRHISLTFKKAIKTNFKKKKLSGFTGYGSITKLVTFTAILLTKFFIFTHPDDQNSHSLEYADTSKKYCHTHFFGS